MDGGLRPISYKPRQGKTKQDVGKVASLIITAVLEDVHLGSVEIKAACEKASLYENGVFDGQKLIAMYRVAIRRVSRTNSAQVVRSMSQVVLPVRRARSLGGANDLECFIVGMFAFFSIVCMLVYFMEMVGNSHEEARYYRAHCTSNIAIANKAWAVWDGEGTFADFTKDMWKYTKQSLNTAKNVRCEMIDQKSKVGLYSASFIAFMTTLIGAYVALKNVLNTLKIITHKGKHGIICLVKFYLSDLQLKCDTTDCDSMLRDIQKVNSGLSAAAGPSVQADEPGEEEESSGGRKPIRRNRKSKKV